MLKMSLENNIAYRFVKELKSKTPDGILKALDETPPIYPFPEGTTIPNNEKRPITVIEVMGFTRSGKSTEIDLLKKDLPEIAQPVIAREFIAIEWDKLKNIAKICGLEIENHLLVNAKVLGLLNAFRAAQNIVKQPELHIGNKPIVVISERGPNDALVYSMWIWRYLEGKKELTEDDWKKTWTNKLPYNTSLGVPPGFYEDHFITFVNVLRSLSLVHAVALYDVSYDEGSRRRIKQGLEPESRMHNPTVRHQLETDYGKWLSVWYPMLSKSQNMALLNVDGNKSAQENHQKIMEFISALI